MTKMSLKQINEATLKNSTNFINRTESKILYNADVAADILDFEWVDIFEYACPYIDNAVRNPKLMLIKEELIEKLEKAKKVTVDTVKHLAKHTYFVDRVDEKTGDVIPSQLLDIRGIDTFNTYENRFIFTLLDKMNRFYRDKVEELENIDASNKKTLEFAAKSHTNASAYKIEMRLSAIEGAGDDEENSFEEKLNEVRPRIEKIRQYLAIWERSEFTKTLRKERAAFIRPPITKTNVIKKNPNFQEAMKVWNFLKEFEEAETPPEKGFKSTGDEIIEGLMNHAFTVNYLAMNSFDPEPKVQNEKLKNNLCILLKEEIKTIIDLLNKLDVQISDADILELIALNSNGKKGEITDSKIKDTFKEAMEDYLERTQDFL